MVFVCHHPNWSIGTTCGKSSGFMMKSLDLVSFYDCLFHHSGRCYTLERNGGIFFYEFRPLCANTVLRSQSFDGSTY